MKGSLLIILLVSLYSCYAQKQGNIWYFGNGAGLDFSSGTATAIFNGKTGTDVPPGSNQEGTACIADSMGRLLFYTGGATIWNRNHIAMPNGTGIMGGVSSTQTSIIVPKPGSDSLFYVFTSGEFQSYYPPLFPEGYRYTVVNMCLDSGRGDVIINQKNILLLDSSTEKLAVCEDASGNGYWVMGHKMFSNEFYAWHLTSTGISPPVISRIGTIHGWNHIQSVWNNGSAQGQMKINPQGTKIVLAISNHAPATVGLFDFNKNTGTVSNFCHIAIDSVLNKRVYGVEFSPDGTRFYAGVAGGTGGKRLYQYTLTAGDCNAIINSRVNIFQSDKNSVMLGMQLAPNDKIYLVCNEYKDIGCINFPNLFGAAAGFDSLAVSIAPAYNGYTFPAFIAGFKYHNKVPCDSSFSTPPVPDDPSCNLHINTKVYPNPFNKVLLVNKKQTACKVTMRLYNTLGQLVKKDITINNGTNLISVFDLPSGVYFYRFISNENSMLSGKLIKL